MNHNQTGQEKITDYDKKSFSSLMYARVLNTNSMSHREQKQTLG